jgi:hypothetical protein
MVNSKSVFPYKTCLIIFMMLILSCCGYQMIKEKGIFGGEISSIYIPLFKNKTFEPHAPGYVTDAFAKELVATGIFKLNKENSDGYIQGIINKIKIVPSSMNAQGVVVEKNVEMTIDLSLFSKTGAFIKRWTLTENEIYNTKDINSEDYNKREALTRMSGRIARKFSAIALIDY